MKINIDGEERISYEVLELNSFVYLKLYSTCPRFYKIEYSSELYKNGTTFITPHNIIQIEHINTTEEDIKYFLKSEEKLLIDVLIQYLFGVENGEKNKCSVVFSEALFSYNQYNRGRDISLSTMCINIDKINSRLRYVPNSSITITNEIICSRYLKNGLIKEMSINGKIIYVQKIKLLILVGIKRHTEYFYFEGDYDLTNEKLWNLFDINPNDYNYLECGLTVEKFCKEFITRYNIVHGRYLKSARK